MVVFPAASKPTEGRERKEGEGVREDREGDGGGEREGVEGGEREGVVGGEREGSGRGEGGEGEKRGREGKGGEGKIRNRKYLKFKHHIILIIPVMHRCKAM